MKLRVDVDCTPEEARAFLGLPDVAPLNARFVEEMSKRLDSSLGGAGTEEMMRYWMNIGGQATEQFRKLFMSAATGSAATPKGG